MCEYSLSSETGDGLRSYSQDQNRYDLPERRAQGSNPRSVADEDNPHATEIEAEGMGNRLFIPQYQGHLGVQEQYTVEVQDPSQLPNSAEPHRTVVEIHQDSPPVSWTPAWPQDIWLHNESCRVLYQPVLVFPHPRPGCPPPRPMNPDQPSATQEADSHHFRPDSLVAVPPVRHEPEDEQP